MINVKTVKVGLQFMNQESGELSMEVDVFSGGPLCADVTLDDKVFRMDADDIRELASTLLEALKV